MQALAGVLTEMDSRYDAYNHGQSYFDRLSVLIDEVPAIVLRDKAQWAAFASQLGSEARKVNMSMLLLTQSPLVRDIEISSVMRENFTRIALGDQASVLIEKEESNTKRKTALLEQLRGQEHPAAMEYRGEVHLLDTTNVPGLAKTAKRAQLWMPPTTQRITKEVVLIKALRAAKAKGWNRDQARASGLRFDNDLWSAL